MNKKKLIVLTILIFLSLSCTSKQKTPPTSLPPEGENLPSAPQTSDPVEDKKIELEREDTGTQEPKNVAMENDPSPQKYPFTHSQLNPGQSPAIPDMQPEQKGSALLLAQVPQPPQPVETPLPTEPQPAEAPSPPQPPEALPPSQQTEPTGVTDQGVAFNFDNVDIKDFIDMISEITGENFILSPGVSGRVTIITTGRIPKEDVFSVLESVLEVNNLTVVRSGQFYKVIPIAIARQKPIETTERREEVERDDRVVTHIVRLKNISPIEAMNVLGPFISQTSGNLHPHPRSNILIITDLASNVRRLLSILEEIDVNLYERLQIEIFYIQQVALEDLVKEMEQILSTIADGAAAAGQGGLIVKFVPITRYNALMLITSSSKVIQLVREWVKILDQPIKEVGRRNFIYYVKHSKAADLAKVLEQLYRGRTGERVAVTEAPTPTAPEPTRRREERLTPRPSVQPPTAQPIQPRQPLPPQPGQPQPPISPLQQPGQVTTPTESLITPGRDAEVLIVADELTNSLIIRTSPAEFQAIKELLDELDLRPAQVLIETLIVEVTLDKSTLFGIQGTLLGQDQITLGGETNSVQSRSRTTFPDVTASSTGFTYVLQAAGRFAAQLRALATENRVKVLSNPHILVRNNEKAIIQVGEEIPILAGVSAVPAPDTAVQQLINAVQYRDIGIILRVTPRINKEGAVVLDVEQEVSSVLSQSFGDTRSPSFGKRNSSTSVVAQNGQTLVIGGLIRENRSHDEQGVPGIARVPLLGRLFRSETNSVNKNELLILVTPQVIEEPREGDKMSRELSGKIQALEKFFDKNSESDLDKILKFLKLSRGTPAAPIQ